jgi:hypothetical protein
MACRRVRVSADVRALVLERYRFRGVRSTHGELDPGAPALATARVDCQLGIPRGGQGCQRCPRLLSWTSGPNPGEVTLRCAWLHTDPVADRMTGAAALVTVAARLRCREARRMAQREGVHRLLVLDDGQLVGIVCRCDLEPAPSEPVRSVMRHEVFIVDAATTLAEAAALMRALDVGCLPVARDGDIVGIITRGDLVRSGLPEARLP